MGFDDMKGDDGGDEPGDFLEEERKNDPTKLQREAIALQREGLAFLREKMNSAPPGIVGRVYEPLAPTSITFQIRKISNGFVLAKQGNHQLYNPEGPHAEETYYQTIPQLLEGLDKVVEGAFPPSDPTPDVPEGT